MNRTVIEIREHLKNKLNPVRYEHTLGVSFTCMALAMCYHYDLEKAELAGLLHDCAKRYDNDSIVKKCIKHGVQLTESELMAPSVIHAKLGAWMAEHKYGVDNPEILSAIACHTTGKPEMSLLDKILYIADFIEPRRQNLSGLEAIRELAFKNLDAALFETMKGILEYLKQSGTYVDAMTEEAYEYYKVIREEQLKNEAVKRNGTTRCQSVRGKKRRRHQSH